MKNLKCLVILFTVAVAMFMTACQKDASEELAPERVASEVQEESARVTIEYTSLEELNAVYVEHGLEPITLEDLGITQEEYNAAQERINNEESASSRGTCPHYINVAFTNDGDMNNSGSLTVYDIVMARRVRLELDPPSHASDDFGTLSWTWDGTDYTLTIYDEVLAERFILGVLC